MNLQSVVDEVKGHVENFSAHGQKVAEISLDSLKQAGDVVVETVQTLVKDSTALASDLYSSALTSFEKAKSDGIKAVVADPIAYLPPKEPIFKTFNHTVTIVTKSGDELFKVAKTGFSSIQAELSGKPATVDKVTRSVKSAAKKATASAKKAASKIEKAVK
jgi:hypothetical protein